MGANFESWILPPEFSGLIIQKSFYVGDIEVRSNNPTLLLDALSGEIMVSKLMAKMESIKVAAVNLINICGLCGEGCF